MGARKIYTPDEKYGYTGIDGASLITGYSKSSLYKMTSKCILPHIRLGGKLIFKIDELVQFIEQNRVSVIK
jgi:hypothetical protein